LYAKVFGAENVGVFVFEELRARPESFAEKIASHLGIGVEETVKCLVGQQHNKAKSESFLRMKKAEHRYARLRQRWFPNFDLARQAPVLNDLKEACKKWAARRAAYGDPATNEISESTEKMVRAYFRESNRVLAQKWSLNSDDWDYLRARH